MTEQHDIVRRILSDGEWHIVGELAQAVYPLISPEVAVRAVTNAWKGFDPALLGSRSMREKLWYGRRLVLANILLRLGVEHDGPRQGMSHLVRLKKAPISTG